MDENIIEISRKSTKRGEDGYKTFSIRIREETVRELEQLAKNSNRSRNELINIFLEYGVSHSQVVE